MDTAVRLASSNMDASVEIMKELKGEIKSTVSEILRKPDEFKELTERELETLELIAQGDTNMIIANKLSLSIKTVQNYVSSILTKLQAADRGQAIVRAREAGFGSEK